MSKARTFPEKEDGFCRYEKLLCPKYFCLTSTTSTRLIKKKSKKTSQKAQAFPSFPKLDFNNLLPYISFTLQTMVFPTIFLKYLNLY